MQEIAIIDPNALAQTLAIWYLDLFPQQKREKEEITQSFKSIIKQHEVWTEKSGEA